MFSFGIWREQHGFRPDAGFARSGRVRCVLGSFKWRLTLSVAHGQRFAICETLRFFDDGAIVCDDAVQQKLPNHAGQLPNNITVQEFGDDVAKGLGVPVQLHRGVLFAGSAVSVARAVGFVGLIGPHIARKLVGPSFGTLIPAAALVGALLVLVSDTAARTVFLPLDIPAGVFTAGVGAPLFIYLLYRNRNR
jgi:iron complex transport system permease protein